MASLLNSLSDPPNWWTALYRLAVLALVATTIAIGASNRMAVQELHTEVAGVQVANCQ
jgi:hypothetical protein